MEQMPMLGLGEIIIMLLFGVIVVWPFWRIFSRAGFSGALALLLLVPLLNLMVIWYLAFAEWPALKTPQPGSP